jgi:hypothetical protein
LKLTTDFIGPFPIIQYLDGTPCFLEFKASLEVLAAEVIIEFPKMLYNS